MRVRSRFTGTLIAALVITTLASCQKKEDEVPAPGADDAQLGIQASELNFYRTDNGISVYLQEETSHNLTAAEVHYRAGFIHEPAGQPQVSHIAEHVMVVSATESYGVGEAVGALSKGGGLVGAEAMGDFTHFAYVFESDYLEEFLKIEAERLTSVRFEDSVRETQAAKAAKEISSRLGAERASLRRFGMITMLHALQHGNEFVPIMQANHERTVEEIGAFHKQHYRTDDMTLVLIGNFETEAVRALIDKYLGGIPSSPEPPRYDIKTGRNVSVRWDIDATAVGIVYPGPFDDKEAVALVIIGSYLSQYIARAPEIPGLTNATFTTNPTYNVERLPFFVYGDPARYRSASEVRDALVRLTDEAVATLDERMFERVKASIRTFILSSFLERSLDDIQVDHHELLGQQAYNVAMKHYLMDGRPDDEYLALIDSLTFDDLQQILAEHLGEDNRTIVMISGP
jgi:zinc protease